MARITGSGCMLSAMLGAYLAISPTMRSAWECCRMAAVCGERAEERMKAAGAGAGTFHVAFLDALST